MEPASEPSLYITRVVALSLLIVRNRSDYSAEWFVTALSGDKISIATNPPFTTHAGGYIVKENFLFFFYISKFTQVYCFHFCS